MCESQPTGSVGRHGAIVLLAAIAGVYLLLACCAYPALDDWVIACRSRDQSLWSSTIDYLSHWGGRWSAFIILALSGSVPGYVIAYPVMVLGGFALAAWAIARCWGWRVALLAGVPLLVWMPSTAEGIYWLPGGVCYLLAPMLLLLSAGLSTTRWAAALRVGLGAVAAGCSETSAVLAAGAMATAWLLHDRRHAWTLAGVFIGGVLALLAPGNMARMAVIAGGQPTDPLAACWSAIPVSGTWLRSMLRQYWLCPVVPALIALALQALPGPSPIRVARTAMATGLIFGSAVVALLASAASVRMLEGRQVDAVWLHLTLGLAVIVWSVLRSLPEQWQRRVLIVWWLLCWLHVARLDPDAWIPLLVATVCIIGGVVLAYLTWRHQRINATAWLALSALAAPGLMVACADLQRAPSHRLEQWSRDAAVMRLQAAGERHLRIPLLTSQNLAPTISMGDLMPGHWSTEAYASYHGLESLLVDADASEVEAYRPQ